MFSDIFFFEAFFLLEGDIRTRLIVTDFFTSYRTAVSRVSGNATAVGMGIEIDAECAVVGSIGSRGGRTDIVVTNDGTRLVGEGVNTPGVIELAGIIDDFIAYDAVVLHTRVVRCPAPSDADARIVDATHVVFADGAVAYIAQRDGHGSPVLSSGINDEVLLNGQPLATFS